MATIRQQLAVEKILENHGNVSKAMKEAGYSESMSKNPQVLTNSEGFRELLEQKLPDSLLLKTHLEGLEANKVVSARAKTKHGDPMMADEDTDDFIEVPDHPTRHKYLETAYKIKCKMTGEAASITNIIVPIVVTRGEGTTEEDTVTSEAI
jgi:hypothetical protein